MERLPAAAPWAQRVSRWYRQRGYELTPGQVEGRFEILGGLLMLGLAAGMGFAPGGWGDGFRVVGMGIVVAVLLAMLAAWLLRFCRFLEAREERRAADLAIEDDDDEDDD